MSESPRTAAADATVEEPQTRARLLTLEGISKSYGSLAAVQNVNLDVNEGEIVALVGDNGAGKSTLLKIMAGFHSPDKGRVIFRGKEVNFASPRDARACGIETVYQDLALIPGLSLWRNFFLGRELSRRIGLVRILDRKAMERTTTELLREMGLTRLRSSDEPVNILSGGERQALAIARAHYFGGALLLLDEPTAALSVRETERVGEAVEAARALRAGIVIIDHNISHVHGIADRTVVLENGRVLASFTRAEIKAEALVAMVGGRHALTGTAAE